MRILHVLDHSLPLHSGYTFRTAAILREQRARGWETFQLTTPRHGEAAAEQEEAGGLTFHRTPQASNWRASVPVVGRYLAEMNATERRLESLARRLQPDVIHAHSPVLDALPALAVGRRLGIPVVYEVRAFWEDAAVDHGSTTEGSVRYRVTRGVESRALRAADGVVVICDGLRRDIEARGIAADRIVTVPNAVDADRFRFCTPRDEALADRLGLRGRTVIGFLGSFYAYEGLDLLLEAVARLLRVRPDVRLLLAGGGPEDADLRARVGALGIGGTVVFTGRVDHAEVPRYYSLVDVLAYPRHPMRLTEIVTPLKPLEAMALGHVVVASDVGGHRELIDDGDNGYLFRAGDPDALAAGIQRALSDPAGADALRVRARRFVEEKRTWRNSVSAYAPLYERLARPGRVAAVASPA